MFAFKYFQIALLCKTERHTFWFIGIALMMSGNFVNCLLLSSVMENRIC